MNNLLLLSALLIPSQHVIYLTDDSVVKAKINHDKFTLQTDFGNLNIPYNKVSYISYGLLPLISEEKEIIDKVHLLGDSVFNVRDKVFKQLKGNKYAYRYIHKELDNSDLEIKTRCRALLEGVNYIEKDYYDYVFIKDQLYSGRILDENIKITSLLGDSLVSRKFIHKIYRKVEFNFKISETNTWINTGQYVFNDVYFKAEGEIDLYPQNPKTYMSTASGNKQYSHNGYPSGLLMGKVEDKEFAIGSESNFQLSFGKLYLKIVGTSWGNKIEGNYDVTIK